MGRSSSRAPSVERAATPAKRDEVACFHAKYRLGDKLGKGAYGQVRIATEVSSSKQWAVKIMDVSCKVNPSEVDQKKLHLMTQEVEIQKIIGNHSHIVEFHEAVIETPLCYLVMEECKKSLWSLLDGLPHLSESELVQVFKQMLIAIAHIHSLGVVHRDVKPDNFLSTNDGITLKLCDFGLSVALPPEGGLKDLCGTAPYMSPEMLRRTGYDGRTDVWSCGIIGYAFLFGRLPYGRQSVSSWAPNPSFLVDPDLVGGEYEPSRAATEFVASLLRRSKEERPSASQALCNELFALECDTRASGNMPSFRPMLYASREAGAFEKKDLSTCDNVDCLLSDLQLQYQDRTFHMGPEINKPVGDSKARAPEKEVENAIAGSRPVTGDTTAQESTECSDLSRSKSNTSASSVEP